MIKRRRIRLLTTYSKTHYFIDKGQQRGITCDAFKEFEEVLNKKYKTGMVLRTEDLKGFDEVRKGSKGSKDSKTFERALPAFYFS